MWSRSLGRFIYPFRIQNSAVNGQAASDGSYSHGKFSGCFLFIAEIFSMEFVNSTRTITVLFAVSKNGCNIFALAAGWIHAYLRVIRNFRKSVLRRERRRRRLVLRTQLPDNSIFHKMVRFTLFLSFLSLNSHYRQQNFTQDSLNEQDVIPDPSLNVWDTFYQDSWLIMRGIYLDSSSRLSVAECYHDSKLNVWNTFSQDFRPSVQGQFIQDSRNNVWDNLSDLSVSSVCVLDTPLINQDLKLDVMYLRADGSSLLQLAQCS